MQTCSTFKAGLDLDRINAQVTIHHCGGIILLSLKLDDGFGTDECQERNLLRVVLKSLGGGSKGGE